MTDPDGRDAKLKADASMRRISRPTPSSYDDGVGLSFNLQLAGYGSAAMLAWKIGQKELAPHIPVWDKTARKDNTLSSREFQWDELANEYRCPTGYTLRSGRRKFRNPRSRVTKADTNIYRASQLDCESCSVKDRCCPNTSFRKIARSIH